MEGLSDGRPPDKPAKRDEIILGDKSSDGSNTGPKEAGPTPVKTEVHNEPVENKHSTAQVDSSRKEDDLARMFRLISESMTKTQEEIVRLHNRLDRVVAEAESRTRQLQEQIEVGRQETYHQRRQDLENFHSHISELGHEIEQARMDVEQSRLEKVVRDEGEERETYQFRGRLEDGVGDREMNDGGEEELEPRSSAIKVEPRSSATKVEQDSREIDKTLAKILEHQDKMTEKMLRTITEIAVDKQVTQSTKTRHREQVIEKASKNPLIRANRAQPDLWLLNLNRLSNQKDWADSEYCKYLPRLWNLEAKDAWRTYFSTLPQGTKENRVELDRAFLKEFDRTGLRGIKSIVTESKQGRDKVKDFIASIRFARNMWLKWAPRSVPSEAYVVGTLRTRLSSREMKKQMIDLDIENGGIHDLNDLVNLADRVDRRDEVDNEGEDTVHIRRVATADAIVDVESGVHQILMENREDDEVEHLEKHYAAEDYLLDKSTVVNKVAVFRVLTQLQGGVAPAKVWTQRDVQAHGHICVVNGPLAKQCAEKKRICAWHACKGKCISNRCNDDHVARENSYCPSSKADTCKKGAYCQYRHRGDTYDVFFWDRNRQVYKQYKWKDVASKFSKFYNGR